MEMANCFCYILECADGSYYTGWSTDPKRRARQHNLGRGAHYTSMRRPVRLVYIEPQPDRSAALRRERKIKNLTHAQKKALVQFQSLEQGCPDVPDPSS
jgi:putative endonuclease